MRTFIVRLSVALLVGVALAAQATYRISIDPWIAWAPAVVAQQKGFFAAHGVAVEVVVYTVNDSLPALRAGRNDFALAMAGTAIGMRVRDGVDLAVVAEVDWSHGGDKILVRRGGRLEGGTGGVIGVYEDSPAVNLFLQAGLRARGLAMKDFRIVEFSDLESLASQFTAGRLCAAVSYEPYVRAATDAGACDVVATTADFPGIMPECIVARRERLAAIPVGDVAAVLRGWIDGVEWMGRPENREEFTRLCLRFLFVDEKPKQEEFDGLLANVRIHDRATLRARNLGDAGIARFLTECVDFAMSRNPGAARPETAQLLDTRALRLALDDSAASPGR